MNDKLRFYLKEMKKNELGASDMLINETKKQLNFILPVDYIDLVKEFNGGEGEIGENSWLNLFPIDSLVEKNYNYRFLMNDIPDYFLFGKDSADTGFAFHKEKQTIHSFGLMSDFNTDPIEFCGNNFSEFIEYLFNK